MVLPALAAAPQALQVILGILNTALPYVAVARNVYEQFSETRNRVQMMVAENRNPTEQEWKDLWAEIHSLSNEIQKS